MWQTSSTNGNKLPIKHLPQTDSVEHILKRNIYGQKHPQSVNNTSIPNPPIPFDNRINAFIPNHTFISTPPLPSQINAHSHTHTPHTHSPPQYTAYPSTYKFQYQMSKARKSLPASHNTKAKNNTHKRSKSNARLQRTSIPPPPMPRQMPQQSFSHISSTAMEPIPEELDQQIINTCDLTMENGEKVLLDMTQKSDTMPETQSRVVIERKSEENGMKSNDTTPKTKSVALSHSAATQSKMPFHSTMLNGHHSKDTFKSRSSVMSMPFHSTMLNGHGSKDTFVTHSSVPTRNINMSAHKSRLSVSLNPMSKRDRFREKIRDKNILNDSFWEQNRKIPYIGLAMTTSTFFILVFIYFTNLYRLLFGGLVPCLIALMVLLPIYWFFRKYDIALKYKTIAIQNHIDEEEFLLQENGKLYVTNKDLSKENEDLSNNLQLRCNEISKQKKKIYELSKIIAVKQAQNPQQGFSGQQKDLIVKKRPVKTRSLLEGFRKGQMERQLEVAEVNDLVHMLPIVTSCITLLPFGMTHTRKKLLRILERRISEDHYLRMQFYFFLVSFLGCLDVKRLFRKHKLMKLVNETSTYYAYAWDDEKCGYLNSGDRVYSRRHSINSDTTTKTITTMANTEDMFSPTNVCDEDGNIMFNSLFGNNVPKLPPINIHSNDPSGDVDDIKVLDEERKQFVNVETVIYTEKDPVKLFRMPIDKKGAVGFKVIVPKNLQSRFFDPINGNKYVQQLRVRKIFNSNARPYLIDCYVSDEQKNEVRLSSAYILKRGDDLRKDGAVLKMFEFMNEIWKSNNLRYKGSLVSSLTYKCIPIGPDVGIIEEIPNCIELNKVMSLRQTLKQSKNVKLWTKLVASSAGAFIAAFIMGIRDRHDDNILINMSDNGYNLFHIDFGYMFGDRVPLDTAKLAITSGLKNIFDIYHFGWNDFIDICIQSWLILRNNANEIIDYARCVFSFLYQTQQIEMYLRTSLKLDISDDQIASKYIYDKLKNAPKHLKTKVKNLVHGFAQKIKSNGPIGTQPSSIVTDYNY